jgi:hypothetical protein
MKKCIYFSLLFIWSFSINAMHENRKDLEKDMLNAMTLSAKLELYSDDECKHKGLIEQVETEQGIEELAKYFTAYNEWSESMPSKEAYALKYPEDYQRLGELHHASLYNTWVNPVEEKEEYSLLLKKERNYFKNYVIDKKKQGLPLYEYEERNSEYMLMWEELRK